jgi:hypothetical protein
VNKAEECSTKLTISNTKLLEIQEEREEIKEKEIPKKSRSGLIEWRSAEILINIKRMTAFAIWVGNHVEK